MVRIAATEGTQLRLWTDRVAAMRKSGELTLIRSEADTMLHGRTHDRLRQQHRGVPVWGAEIVVQRAGETIISVFGALHEGISLDVQPDITAETADTAAKAFAGADAAVRERARLVVYPDSAQGYVLAYLVRTRTAADDLAVFVDARTAKVIDHLSERMTRL